jgi:hypothetical protein
VRPRAGLDTEATGKIILPLPRMEPRSAGHPLRSQTLYCPSSPAPHMHIQIVFATISVYSYRLQKELPNTSRPLPTKSLPTHTEPILDLKFPRPAARLGLGALGAHLGSPKLGGPKSITNNPFFLVLHNSGCKLQSGRFLVANAATKLYERTIYDAHFSLSLWSAASRVLLYAISLYSL